MQLLHHVYVVISGIARAAPADVFKAAGHVLLTVEIVRLKRRRAELASGGVEHLRHVLARGERDAPLEQIGALFECQRVNGDVARLQREHLPHRLGKRCRRVAGKPRDEIHVDVVKARLACHPERLDGLGGSVAAADGTQNAVGHRLGVDGDARRAARADGAELRKVERVGPAALHGELQRPREVKMCADRVQKPRHLRRGERGRRAAADVQAADVPAGAL